MEVTVLDMSSEEPVSRAFATLTERLRFELSRTSAEVESAAQADRAQAVEEARRRADEEFETRLKAFEARLAEAVARAHDEGTEQGREAGRLEAQADAV